MTIEILDNIPFELRSEMVMRVLRVKKVDPRIEQGVREVISQVSAVAHPKALYRVSCVDNKGKDFVQVDEVVFTSKVMAKNLSLFERVFPYVATCGTEVESLAFPGDVLKTYYLDAVKMTLVGMAVVYLTDYLQKRFTLGQTARMNPGSLADWPLPEQRKLFSLLGDVENLIGVRLTENCIMYPLKSVSGIIFPTEVRYENCQLCPRENCMGRRAPYSPELVHEYLGK